MAKWCVLISVLALIVACFGGLSIGASAEENLPIFESENAFLSDKVFDTIPVTFEATVFFPKEMFEGDRGGIIIGNYESSTPACISFEIHQKGAPRYFVINADGGYDEVVFDQINVYTGEWTHLAVVINHEKSEISCYVNGECKQTIQKAFPAEVAMTNPMVIGGDMRSGNKQYFKGSIRNISLYSDMRTADEILADGKEAGKDTAELMAHYDLTGKTDTLTDANGKGVSFKLQNRTPFVYDHKSVTDYDFSFAIVGDTQTMTYLCPESYTKMYDWIVANAESKKMEFVFGLGDITEDDSPTEWKLAKKELSKLKNVVPHSIIRGNHDGKRAMEQYLPYEDFKDTITGSYDSTLLNTYHEIEIGDIKYLMLNLDFENDISVFDWANEVIEDHKDYNVIISTHMFLNGDGTRSNDGNALWENVAKKHENVVMILSGHVSSDKVVVSKAEGDNGNEITQILVNPQGIDGTYQGGGFVAMLYVSSGGRTVDVEYYSTVREALFKEENQFRFEMNVIKPAGAFHLWWLLAIIPVAAVVVIVIVVAKKKKKTEAA